MRPRPSVRPQWPVCLIRPFHSLPRVPGAEGTEWALREGRGMPPWQLLPRPGSPVATGGGALVLGIFPSQQELRSDLSPRERGAGETCRGQRVLLKVTW